MTIEDAVDISFIQDEDVLRRLWQDTEDFSRKKEIRARMYKLREQRLKEFYTTGEVLSDVQKATPQKLEIESTILPKKHMSDSSETMTHTNSIKDCDFMTMKSKEMRDSESPTRDYQMVGRNSGNDGQSYWKMESSSQSYQAVGRDGQYQVSSQSHQRNMAGENDRITANSAYSTENKSVIDRNGDVKVLSSREFDTSGREVSPYGSSRISDGQTMHRSLNQSEMIQNVGNLNDDNIRYIEDGEGGKVMCRTSGSRTSETRVASSSQVHRSSVQTQKWSSSSRTSSSSVTSSKGDTFIQEGNDFGSPSGGGTREIIYYTEEYPGDKGSSNESRSVSEVSKRSGVVEVKKTVIRGGKVITETVTYVDGKPVDGNLPRETPNSGSRKSSQPETVTVIRGGKLIKETVPSKKDDNVRRVTTDSQKTSSVDSSKRSSTESFISSERRSTERQNVESTEGYPSQKPRQPDDADSQHLREPYDDEPQKREPQFVNQNNIPPKTVTVIRGGKVIKEKVPSDTELTNELIKHESTVTERSRSQKTSRTSYTQKSTSETSERTSEIRDDQRRREPLYDEDETPDYQEPDQTRPDDTRSRKEPQDTTGRRSSPAKTKPEKLSEEPKRKPSTDGKSTSSTKTVTVIRGGKIIKETVVDTDETPDQPGKRAPGKDGARPSQPSSGSPADSRQPNRDVDDDVPDKTRDGKHPSRASPASDRPGRKPSGDQPENDDRQRPVPVKTVTVIRGGKLIKETVSLSKDEARIYDVDEEHSPNKDTRGTPEYTSPDDHLRGNAPRSGAPKKPRDDEPDTEDATSYPRQKPRDDKPEYDEDDDQQEYYDDNVEYKTATTKQRKTEMQTVTVIRGGKIIKEKVTKTREDDEPDVNEPGRRKPSDQSSPRKGHPERDEPDRNDRRPSKTSPNERGDRKSKEPEDDDRQEPQSVRDGSSPEKDRQYPLEDETIYHKGGKPCKLITVIRAGKLIKEFIPLTEEEIREKRVKKTTTVEYVDQRKPSQPSKQTPDQDRPRQKTPVEGTSQKPRGSQPGRDSEPRKPGDKSELQPVPTTQKGRKPHGTYPEDEDEPEDDNQRPVKGFDDKKPMKKLSEPERGIPGLRRPDDQGRESPAGDRRRPEDDRPGRDYPEGDRPTRPDQDRQSPAGDRRRPGDDRPGKDYPEGQRPMHPDEYRQSPDGDRRRPGDDRPGRDYPEGQRPTRPDEDRETPFGRRPEDGRPGMDYPEGQRPTRPDDDRQSPAGDRRRPGDDRPGRDYPEGQRPTRPDEDRETPYGDRRRPGDDMPGKDYPEGQRPMHPDEYRQSPDGDRRRPGDDRPGRDYPEGQRPTRPDQDRQSPAGDRRKPGDDRPGKDYPEGQRPTRPDDDRQSPFGDRRPGDDRPGRDYPDQERQSPGRYSDKPKDGRPDRYYPDEDDQRPEDRELPGRTDKKPKDGQPGRSTTSPEKGKPRDGYPDSEHPDRDEDRPLKSVPHGRPEKGQPDDKSRKPSKGMPDTDDGPKPVKTVTVIRGGKLVKETVQLTEEEIRDRKLETERFIKMERPDEPEDDDREGQRPLQPGKTKPGDKPDRETPKGKPLDGYPASRRPGQDEPEDDDRQGQRPVQPGKTKPGDKPDRETPKGKPLDGYPASRRPGQRPDEPDDDDDREGQRPLQPGKTKPGDQPDREAPKGKPLDGYPASRRPEKDGDKPLKSTPGGRPDKGQPDDKSRKPSKGTPGYDDEPKPVKTVTVIRGGKLVKETVELTEEEIRDRKTESERFIEMERPDEPEDDDREGQRPVQPGKSKPGDQPNRETPKGKPLDGYPASRRPGQRPDEPEDDDREGQRPLQPGKTKPGDKPDRETPKGKPLDGYPASRRPGQDEPEDDDREGQRPLQPGKTKPGDQPNREAPKGKPLDGYPASRRPGQRPDEPEDDDREGQRPLQPGKTKPGDQPRRESPEKMSPTKGKPKEDHPKKGSPEREVETVTVIRAGKIVKEKVPVKDDGKPKSGREPEGRRPSQRKPDEDDTGLKEPGRKPRDDEPDDYDERPRHEQPDGKRPDKYGKTPEDKPVKDGKQPRSGRPGDEHPDDDHPDDDNTARKHPRRPGDRPDEDTPDHRRPSDGTRRPGDRSQPELYDDVKGTDRPEDRHPSKLRPRDEFPDGSSPDNKRPDRERDSPSRTGKPDSGYPDEKDQPWNKRPDDDGRRPKGTEPGRQYPDENDKTPCDGRPRSGYPDKDEPQYGRPDGKTRRPEDDESPVGDNRRPQPYTDRDGMRPKDGKPGQDKPRPGVDDIDRRPENGYPDSDLPDQYRQKPGDDYGKPDGRRPKDGSPDKEGRRPQDGKPKSDTPDKIGRRPEDDRPDKGFPRTPGREPEGDRPDEEFPNQYRRKPEDEDDYPDEYNQRPFDKRPDGQYPTMDGRKPHDDRPDRRFPDGVGKTPSDRQPKDGRPDQQHPDRYDKKPKTQPGSEYPDRDGKKPRDSQPVRDAPDRFGRTPTKSSPTSQPVRGTPDKKPHDDKLRKTPRPGQKVTTVIRGGKLIKEVVPVDEPSDDEETPNKYGKSPRDYPNDVRGQPGKPKTSTKPRDGKYDEPERVTVTTETNKISIDVNASHAQFASSLRAPKLHPDRPESPSRFIEDYQTPEKKSPLRPATKGVPTRPTQKPTTPRTNDLTNRYPKSSPITRPGQKRPDSPDRFGRSPAKGTRPRGMSPERDTKPLRKGERPSSPGRTPKYTTPDRPQSKITNLISRLSSDTTSSRERRKLTSHLSRSSIKKRTGTPGVSPSTSPSGDRPDRKRERTTSSGSTSSIPTEPESDGTYQKPVRLVSTIKVHKYGEVTDLLESEKTDSRRTQRPRPEDDEDYPRSGDNDQPNRRPGERPNDDSIDFITGESRPKRPFEKYPRDDDDKPYYGSEDKPEDDVPGYRRPKDDVDDLTKPKSQDRPRYGRPESPSTLDYQPSSRRPSSPSSRSPTSRRPKSPTTHSSSISPYSSPERKFPSIGRSPDREGFPVSSREGSPSRKAPTKKPKSPEKTSPQKTTPTKKGLTEYPAQKRFPTKEKKPTDDSPSKKPTTPGSRKPLDGLPGAKTPTSRRPEPSKVKPEPTKPSQKVPLDRKKSDKLLPQKSTPQRPETPRYPGSSTPNRLQKQPDVQRPKTSSVAQPPRSKLKPEATSPFDRTPRKSLDKPEPFGKTPGKQKYPKDTDEEDRPRRPGHSTSITTTRQQKTTVESRDFINTELRDQIKKKPSKRKNIMDFDWNEDTPPEEFLVDASSISSQENLSPSESPDKKPTKGTPGSKGRPSIPQDDDEQEPRFGSKQPGKTEPKTQKKPQSPFTTDDRKPRTPQETDKKPSSRPKEPGKKQPDWKSGKPKSSKKTPGRTTSESSENDSEGEPETEVDFINGERRLPSAPTDEDTRYIGQIDFIRREQETTYGTKVVTTRTDGLQEPTGKVELPKSSRESTRSPDSRLLKCVSVNETDTEELRPRYADKVSEPEEENEFPQRQGLRPQVVRETDEEEPRKSLRDKLVKSTLDKITKDSILDLDDLDVKDETEETVNVSVAERVNKFMETALKPTSPLPSRPEDITLKGLDDTINEYIENNEFVDDGTDVQQRRGVNSVIKAKTMFETIANQTVVTGTARRELLREDDILSRPSVFQSKTPQDKTPRKPGQDYPEDTTSRPGTTPGYTDSSRPDDESPDRYGTSPRKPGDRPDDRDAYRRPDTYGTTPGDRPYDRDAPRRLDESPDRYGTSPRRPGDRPDDRDAPRRPGDRPDDRDAPRRPGDRPDDRDAPRRPGDRPDDRDAPRRPGDRPDDRDAPRRPGDRPDDRDAPRRPGDRPDDRDAPRRPGDRPDDRDAPRRPGDRPDDRDAPRRPGDRPDDRDAPRRPGDRPDDRDAPRRPGDRPDDRDAPRRPGDRPDNRDAPRRPGDRPDDRDAPRRPGDRPDDRDAPRRPGDRPDNRDAPRRPGQSPDSYGTSPRRPGDRPDDRDTSRRPSQSPDRYGTSPKRPGDRPDDRDAPRRPGQSPDRYGTSPRKPGDRPDDRDITRRPGQSPDRYGSPRRPGDRPDDRDTPRRPGQSPDRYGTSPKRPGDRPDDRDTTRRPSQSPDRYGTSPRRPGDRPDDRDAPRRPGQSPDRYGTSPRKPGDRPDDRDTTRRPGQSPDRYGTSPKRPGDRPDDRDTSRRPSQSPDRYGTSPRRPGDRPDDKDTSRRPGQSPDRYGSTPKKSTDKPYDRNASPFDRLQKPTDKSTTPSRPGGKLFDQPTSQKPKGSTPDRYGVVPDSPRKKSTSPDTSRRPGQKPDDRDTYPKGKTQAPYSSPSNLYQKPDRDSPQKRPGQTQPDYTGRKPTDQDTSPRRKSESPNRYDSSPGYTTSRPGTTPQSSRPKPSDGYDSPKYGSQKPERPGYSPDDYPRSSPTRPTDLTDRRPSNRYDSPDSTPTKKSPSKELADQIRRLGSPKKETPTPSRNVTSRYPYSKPKDDVSKPSKTKPSSVVDKHSLTSFEKKTSTTTVDTFLGSRTSPEKLFSPKPSKPLFDDKPKVNGYLPEDTCVSPTSPTRIPENSILKAPALLKKQKEPDEKRYTSSIYRSVHEDKQESVFDEDDSPLQGRPSKKSPLDTPGKPFDSKVSKFGVTLKKTTSGGSLVRKGPVDIGKKETELDRTYDLDLLEAMLERARGYEERRLIRGQIRIVRKLIEDKKLPQPTTRRPSDFDVDGYDSPKSPGQRRPSGDIFGTNEGKYSSYRSETTTETVIRTSSPERYQPDSSGKYPARSSVTLTLSSKDSLPSRRSSTSPEKPLFTDRRPSDKGYPSSDFGKPGYRRTPDREPSGTLIDSETRRRSIERQRSPDSTKKPTRQPSKGDDLYPGSKTYSSTLNKSIKKSHTEHETKETNITDSIISSYGVGPTDDKGRPLFGLQALKRQKSKPDVDSEFLSPQENDSPRDIRDSSGRAFFGLKALRTPRNESEQPESPTLKDLVAKHERHSIGTTFSQTQQHTTSSRLRDSLLRDDEDDEFIRREIDSEDVSTLMAEPGQSLKDMIRKHERLMEGEPKRSENVTSSSYSTSTVVRSSAVRKPDGTISVKKNVIRGETTAENDKEPRTRITTSEYSYETPDREPVNITEVDSEDERSFKKKSSARTVSSRSTTSDSIYSRGTSSVKTTRKSLSPDRKSTERYPTSFGRPTTDDVTSYSRTREETDVKTSRNSISDRLTQLSKKFSNDSLDSPLRKSGAKDPKSDSHISSYTRTSSTFRSSIDGTSSPLTDSYKYEPENDVPGRRWSSSHHDDDTGVYRRGSSTPIDDVKETLYRKFSGSEDTEQNLSSFARVGKGGSVKALSQKFQQAAAEAEAPKTVASYPKAGLILRSTSFKQTNGELTSPDSPGLRQSISMEVRVGSPTRSGINTQRSEYTTDRSRNELGRSWSPGNSDRIDRFGDVCERRVVTQTTTEIRGEGGKSFLGNSSKVTGAQDIINRMRAADYDTDDTCNDSEAKALLNKFLGASVMMSGMEPLVKGSGATSATLVSQVERQRLLDSPVRTGSRDYTSSSEIYRDIDNVEDIWDERKLRQLLDACTDYEGRRKLRARLRTVMAEKSACEDIVAAAREEEESKLLGDSSRSIRQGESNLPYLVEQLRTTLALEPRPNSSPSSEEGANLPHIEDSGTESGEDLRLLAGLRDSISEEQITQKNEIDTGLLVEVQNALKKLQTTLDTGLATDKVLDPETRDNLLQLVVRLQSSLKMTPGNTKPPEDTKSPNRNRFANRRLLRQNRHTVGVTSEELADARRLFEENKDRAPLRLNTGLSDTFLKAYNKWEPARVDKPEVVLPAASFAVVKQSSAGDLVANPSNKSFRPVQFSPTKTRAPLSSINTVAKPFSPPAEFQAVESNSPNQLPSFRRMSEGTHLQSFNYQSVCFPSDLVVNKDAGKNSRCPESTAEGKTLCKDSSDKNLSKTVFDCDDKKTVEKAGKAPLSPPLKNIQYAANLQLEKDSHQQKVSSDRKTSLTNASNDALSDETEPKSAAKGQELVHSNTFVEQSNTSKPHAFKHSLSEDHGSSLLEYDPSLNLFTPEQSVRIAVHKAAINKQLSREEEKRKRRLSIESDLGSSDEEGLDDDGDISSDNEEDDLTVKQSKVLLTDAGRFRSESLKPVYNSNENEAKVSSEVRNETRGSSLPQQVPKANYQAERTQPGSNLRFEKRIQEIQSENRVQNKGNPRSIEELQKIYNERKEKETERKGSIESRSQMMQNVQAKYEKTLASKAPTVRTYNHPGQQLNADVRSKYESRPRKSEESLYPKGNQVLGSSDFDRSPGEMMDVSQTESELSISSTSTENSVCHAQKLLQMVTNEKGDRYHCKSDKKTKMKRANTIDIPKPLNFYEVEDDSEYSEDEQSSTRQNTPLNGHYSGSYKPNSNVPPQLNPKTESDKRFLAFLAKQSQPVMSGTIWKKGQTQGDDSSTLTGGRATFSEHQWGNRFSRIKTAFENTVDDDGVGVKVKSPAVSSAKAFWKSADDSATVVKPKGEFYATANGARLTRQGSKLLKKLFEEKERDNKGGKLPWTNYPNDNVVVGSLTVCTQKTDKGGRVFPSVDHSGKPATAKTNQFQNAPSFTHAPTSAFKPVQKKSVAFGENQKVSSGQPMLPVQPTKANSSTKQFAQNFEGSKSPLSPTLPWIKENGAAFGDKSVNSTLAKFETLSASRTQEDSHSRPDAYATSVASPPHFITKSPSQPSLISNRSEPLPPSYFNVPMNVSKPSQTQRVPFVAPVQVAGYVPPSQVKEKAKNFQIAYQSDPSAANVGKKVISESEQEKFKPIATYSVDVAATSTVYANCDIPRVETDFLPSPDVDTNASTPEEHVAITRVMGSAVQQQAVTVRQKTHRRDDGEDKSSALRNLANVLQRFSSPEQRDLDISKKLSPSRSSISESTPPRSPLVPPKLPTGKTSPVSSSPGQLSTGSSVRFREDNSFVKPNYFQDNSPDKPVKQMSAERHFPVSRTRKTSSAESLVTTTSSEELRENGESVLTTRLQIPVYAATTHQYRTSSLQDLSPGESPSRSPVTPSSSPTSSVQKSESWHQLNGQFKAKRPQSLIIPNLPTPQRRTPNSLLKTKSSHALGFGGKQFEATMSPSAVVTKQKTVEEYFSVKKTIPKTKQTQKNTAKAKMVELDDSLENVDEAFDALFSTVASSSNNKKGGKTDFKIQNRTSASQIIKSTSATSIQSTRNNSETVVTTRTDPGALSKTRVTSKTSSTYTTSKISSTNKPISPFAKFQQLERQSSGSSSSPSSPRAGNAPLFTFTDPKLSRSASGVKDRLLYWCQVKTKDYKNIQIENFSTSWSNGLAFCALIHHFRPEAFDYDSLSPKERRKNFELAFRVADEVAGIAPLLDVEDMVMMKKPDWKCVFTYVQSIYRRFKDEEI